MADDVPVIPRNNNVLWMCVAAVAVVALVCAAFWIPPRQAKKTDEETGFLTIRKNQGLYYVNVAQLLFPVMPSLYRVRLDNVGLTKWTKTRVGKDQWMLSTVIGTDKFEFKQGKPGCYGAPWGVAWIAPLYSNAEQICFEETKGNLQALANHWSMQDNLLFLTADSDGCLVWTNEIDLTELRLKTI